MHPDERSIAIQIYDALWPASFKRMSGSTTTTRTTQCTGGPFASRHFMRGGSLWCGPASTLCLRATLMASLLCQIQTFRPHRASNRLDGSPRSESGKPARHIGAIAFILGSVALAERRLLIGNYDNVKKEPDQRAVAEEMPVSE